jgi:hypothetical protein
LLVQTWLEVQHLPEQHFWDVAQQYDPLSVQSF